MDYSWSFVDTDKLIKQIKEMEEPEELRRVAAVVAARLRLVGVKARFSPATDLSGMSEEELLDAMERLVAELRRRR
jgi:hypothetical protein